MDLEEVLVQTGDGSPSRVCPCEDSGSKASAIQQVDASNVSEIGVGNHVTDLSNYNKDDSQQS